MGSGNYSGYWVGEIAGTNQGGVAFTLQQTDNKVVGVAKISEPALGQSEYEIAGVVTNVLSLELNPIKRVGDFFLGTVKVVGNLDSEGKLSGKWSSTIGTEGIFNAKKADIAILTSSLPQDNSVFIVHGHDEAAKQGVARFLEQIGVKPVILNEQINRGMTIIEKFENFANRAGFAVVLITPDDYGYPVGREENKKFRPRQNVLLELGYFFATLKRERTFVLTKGDIELPSDVFGIMYEPMDGNDGWKIKLAQELKAAGFTVDLNRVI